MPEVAATNGTSPPMMHKGVNSPRRMQEEVLRASALHGLPASDSPGLLVRYARTLSQTPGTVTSEAGAGPLQVQRAPGGFEKDCEPALGTSWACRRGTV